MSVDVSPCASLDSRVNAVATPMTAPAVLLLWHGQQDSVEG
jgi:hypothetical protein